jgi:hypothetical protein
MAGRVRILPIRELFLLKRGDQFPSVCNQKCLSLERLPHCSLNRGNGKLGQDRCQHLLGVPLGRNLASSRLRHKTSRCKIHRSGYHSLFIVLLWDLEPITCANSIKPASFYARPCPHLPHSLSSVLWPPCLNHSGLGQEFRMEVPPASDQWTLCENANGCLPFGMGLCLAEQACRESISGFSSRWITPQ